jgi:hypothetical protein
MCLEAIADLMDIIAQRETWLKQSFTFSTECSNYLRGLLEQT